MNYIPRSKAIQPCLKMVNTFRPQDVDIKAPFTIFTMNLGNLLHLLGPRSFGDCKHLSVFEILGDLEDNARIAFQKRTFDSVVDINVGDDHYAVFYFKELRKLEDGTYAACYEFEYVLPYSKQDNI